MLNELMKRCLTPFVREMQIKPEWDTTTYPLRWQKGKGLRISSIDTGVEQLDSYISGSVKWCKHFRNLIKLISNYIPGYVSKETKAHVPKKDSYKNVQSIFFQRSPKLETILLSTSRWQINKLWVYLSNGMLKRKKNE